MSHEVTGPRTTTAARGRDTDGEEQVAVPVAAAAPVLAVPLERLLSVAALTPGQACLVAAQLLEAAHRVGASDEPTAGATGLGPVTLDACGILDAGGAHARPGAGADELLKQVLRNARRLPTHPRPEQLTLLHRLEEAAAATSLEADVRAYMLRTAVAETSGPDAGERLAGQLGMLVEACVRLLGAAAPAVPEVPRRALPGRAAGVVSGGVPRTSAQRPSARRAVPTHSPTSRPARRGRARPHRRRTMVVALILVALLAAAYAIFRGTGGDVMDALGLGGGTAESASPRPGHHQEQASGDPRNGGAVPALAARHAGAITGVDLRKAGVCKPGALCPVEVTVHLRPSPSSRTVTWKAGTMRLCRRGLSWSPPTTVTARPGWTTVHASSSVRVPEGDSLALVALTSAPARAQSGPVPVTAAAQPC